MANPAVPAARIPRTTCKLFGAIKALGTIRHSVILVHGPKGCVYHINYILGMRGDRPSEIYTTALDEHDVIFGAEPKLQEAVRFLDRTLRPELLFVLSCCSSEIIGEDVGSAVRDTRTRARTIAITAGGFEGDYHAGYSETLCQLVRELAQQPAAPDPLAVNLIGVLRAGPDRTALLNLPGRIGARTNAVLTAGATREELERVGNAALNIVLCEPAGKEAALLLFERFGTPFITEQIPIGYHATSRFLERVAEALGIHTGSLTAPETETAPDCRFLASRRIAIISGPTRAIALTRFLAGYGSAPLLVVVDAGNSVEEELRESGLAACEVLTGPDHDLILRKLKEHGIDLLLGGMLEQPLAAELGIGHLDVMHGSTATVGYEGARNLARLLEQKTCPGKGLTRARRPMNGERHADNDTSGK